MKANANTALRLTNAAAIAISSTAIKSLPLATNCSSTPGFKPLRRVSGAESKRTHHDQRAINRHALKIRSAMTSRATLPVRRHELNDDSQSARKGRRRFSEPEIDDVKSAGNGTSAASTIENEDAVVN